MEQLCSEQFSFTSILPADKEALSLNLLILIILKREFAPEFLGSIYQHVLSIIGDEDGSLPREKQGREILDEVY